LQTDLDSRKIIFIKLLLEYFRSAVKHAKLKQQSPRRLRRAVRAKKQHIWDYGVIPYEIDNIFSGSHKALFKQAMRHWENFTCLKFVERDPRVHPDYIYFTIQNCGYVLDYKKARNTENNLLKFLFLPDVVPL